MPIAIERSARLRVQELERIESYEANPRERVDATHQRGVDHAGSDQIGAECDGGGIRRAGHDQGLVRTREAEPKRDRVSMGVRQDRVERAMLRRGTLGLYLFPV